MTRPHRRAALACLGGAALAVGVAFALGGLRLFVAVHDLLEISYGDRGDPVPIPDVRLLALLALATLLAAAALAFALAGRRAARALARATLVDVGA